MTDGSRSMMIAWCWVVIVFGLVLAGGAFPATEAPARIALALFGGEDVGFDDPLRFSVGLMGAVTAGWGATVLAVAGVSAQVEAGVARQMWRRVTIAVLGWYVIDSTISVATGFAPNAVSNTLLLGAFLLIVRQGDRVRVGVAR